MLGSCELANEGTLFLDEIGEMPLPLQAKLLRFVQERELEHCVESATVICRDEIVSPAHLSLHVDADAVAEWEDSLSAESAPSGLSLDELEKRYILRTLAECEGNRRRAARLLGIGRNTLLHKLKRYGQAD